MRCISIRRLAACVAALLVLAGCDALAPDAERFAEPRYYTYDFFATFEECEAAQPGGMWINCSQTLAVCPDGRADYMVTDIVHRATYSIRGNRVTLRLRDNPETASRVDFRLAPDRESMTDTRTGLVWTRKPEQEAEATRYTCSA